MFYAMLADAVLLVHLGFIGFVVAGGLLLHRWPWLPGLHGPAVLWGIGIEFSGGVCPLTPLENRLRVLGGEAGYAGGFIDHYLVPIIYPDGLTREVQVLLGLGLGLLNLVVYMRWWRRRPRP
jgi:hypothetical protein